MGLWIGLVELSRLSRLDVWEGWDGRLKGERKSRVRRVILWMYMYMLRRLEKFGRSCLGLSSVPSTLSSGAKLLYPVTFGG